MVHVLTFDFKLYFVHRIFVGHELVQVEILHHIA